MSSRNGSSMKSTVTFFVLCCIIALSPVIAGATSVATQSFPSQGPLPNQVVFKFYNNVTDEYYAFSGGALDLVDVFRPTDDVFFPSVIDPTINVSGQMEAAFSFFGMNCRDAHYPLNLTGFRKALAFLVDKDQIVLNGLRGCGYRVDNLVPPALYTGWSNPSVTFYPYSLASANKTLWRYGFSYNGSHNTFPFTGGNWNGPDGQPIRPIDGSNNITIYYRSDQAVRKLAAQLLERAMKDLGIPARAMPSTPIIIQQVIFLPPFNWDVYTGAWSFSADPDYLWYFFNSKSSTDLNFVGWNNESFDYWSDRMITSANYTEVKEACYLCQEFLADALPYVPLCSKQVVSACKTSWESWVEHVGTGFMNFYSLLQAHPAGADRGGTLRAGLAMPIQSLNPVCAQLRVDWCVLDEIYDTLVRRDPTTMEWQPWMAESFDLQVFNLTATKQGLKVTFNLRDNLTWHDGTKVTSADVEFSYRWLNMPASRGGIGAPTYQLWFPIDRIETPEKLTAIIYCNTTSYFALSSLAYFPILPEHVWSKYTTLEDASAVHPEQIGELIGSGPYTFVQYSSNSNVTLSAFTSYFREPALPQPRTGTPQDLLTILGMVAAPLAVVATIISIAVMCDKKLRQL